MKPSFTLREIARAVGGQVEGDGEVAITGVGSLENATASDLAYLESEKYLPHLSRTRAGAVIVGVSIEAALPANVLRVAQPLVAWAQAVELLRPYERRFEGISDRAYLGRGVVVEEGVGVGPGVFVGDGAHLGRGCEVYPGATIGAGTEIGEETRIYSGVHIYDRCVIGKRVIIHSGAVIGADGYGFAQEKRDDPQEPVRHRKIPQVGRVVIEDDVEIGANTTIDRGAIDDTVIGRGTKIDNLVMVGHNCRIGPHCLLVAQVGLSGSVELGPYVTVAGQAGLVGHLKIGSRAVIAAKSGVLNDVPEGTVVAGSPALPAAVARRAYALIEHLPELRKQVQGLEKRLAALEGRRGEDPAAAQ